MAEADLGASGMTGREMPDEGMCDLPDLGRTSGFPGGLETRRLTLGEESAIVAANAF